MTPTELLSSLASSTKVLGMLWSPENDKIHYTIKLNFSSKVNGLPNGENLTIANFESLFPPYLTKRSILSQVNGIYDPLGLLAPFTVTAKILMRKVLAY